MLNSASLPRVSCFYLFIYWRFVFTKSSTILLTLSIFKTICFFCKTICLIFPCELYALILIRKLNEIICFNYSTFFYRNEKLPFLNLTITLFNHLFFFKHWMQNATSSKSNISLSSNIEKITEITERGKRNFTIKNVCLFS